MADCSGITALRHYDAGLPPDQHSCKWRIAADYRHSGIPVKPALPAITGLRNNGITMLGFPRTSILGHGGSDDGITGLRNNEVGRWLDRHSCKWRIETAFWYSGIPVKPALPALRSWGSPGPAFLAVGGRAMTDCRQLRDYGKAGSAGNYGITGLRHYEAGVAAGPAFRKVSW